MTRFSIILVVLLAAAPASADDFNYSAIAERHPETELDARAVETAEMQGECLVGLKDLNFRPRNDFDPVAEWTNFRAISLLEQFPPCTVLIMMEVARKELLEETGRTD